MAALSAAQNHRKNLGQFFTPPEVAATLARWVLEDRRVRILDPACGDGAFLACHRHSVGVEIDPDNVALARARAPQAVIHEADFFQWATATRERFQVAAGNPPFIRYQQFAGSTRQRALEAAANLGVRFSNLSSSWAPFLVVTASLLKPDGRMAFVVPAEIAHATYARPLLEWLCGHFEHVRIVAFREKLFPQLSEDAWFLYCRGFGGHTSTIALNSFPEFRPGLVLPRHHDRIDLSTWRAAHYRLRKFLLPTRVLSLYEEMAARPGVVPFSSIGHAGIGYVTGANDFFHLRPSEARRRGIPSELLRVAVRKAEQLPKSAVDQAVRDSWIASDAPVMLLHLGGARELPQSVRDYLRSQQGELARQAYKCRNRTPWYAVPDVKIPHAFLSYMSGLRPSLVRNDAGCVCTNSVHAVVLRPGISLSDVQRAWHHALCQLSCELEGHPLGGGLLKLEPGEVANIRLPMGPLALTPAQSDDLEQAIREARSWRHYA